MAIDPKKIQSDFEPIWYNNLRGMLGMLVRERGILLQTQKSAKKGYPIPCVILFERRER